MNNEGNIETVISTVDTAISARYQLSSLLDGVNEAKNQVLTSAAQAKCKLNAHFECLRQCVNDALGERLAALQQSIDSITRDSMVSLEQCEQDIKHRVDIAVHVLDNGKKLLDSEEQTGELSRESVMEFKTSAALLSVKNLPEVPSLWDTAYICVDLPRDDENVRQQLLEAVRDYGCVMSHPPLQVTDISERPAALLVHWALSTASVEDENAASNDVEFDAYRLQLCRGKVSAVDSESTTSSFTDVYEGPNTSHLVTNLDHNVQYSLRVSGGCYADGNIAASWSPWSLPVTWSTSLPRRVWSSNTDGCRLTNDNSTVEMSDAVADDASHRPSVVCMSASSSVQSGHSVSFHVRRSHADTAADEPPLLSEHDGVGLSVSDDVAMDTDDVIFYSFHGGVYISRQLMTTRLPAASLESGQIIAFETELAAANKVRVTIEVNEKVVTFDWNLPAQSAGPAGLNVGGLGGGLGGSVFAGSGFGSADAADKIPLNFFTRLSHPGVAVTVDYCPK